jgi:redox-regulated HSP33 family molecular chaperone
MGAGMSQEILKQTENNMYIRGYAFKPNEKELMKENFNRYLEIKPLLSEGHITITTTPGYKRNSFNGHLLSDKAKELNEKDIALLADHGSLCFGGDCTIRGDRFSGSYSTD